MSDTSIPVLFGTMTGNARDLAESTAKELTKAGFEAVAKDMAEAKPEDLAGASVALFICSTWGEGEPPDDAVPYVERLQAEDALNLQGLGYSVCALGDTSYDIFCGCGKIIDERLAAHGATALTPRVDCDVDYYDLHADWLRSILEVLGQRTAAAA